ncbi:NB-ARC domain-containing protein [Cyclobacterium xiamenense]|uniref:NB-ARC domain-containing protein n=1 Tax=Cyclobacterium xiamenense TaxID=1297121 RepID=A0A1H6U6Y4_9BACT|nr:tetratricopeptide repeat protein [Cyclobacterium xiamenense]SEI88138.1 NB-ARC domain-containing protein [Cyclobacterium xiamenense]
MARQSRTGTLISQNERLASLPEPFSQYYPYYVLSQAVRRTLEDFLKTERAYFDSMKISYGKLVDEPVGVSVFLPRLEDATVDGILCEHFRQFLHILIKNKRDSGDRSKIISFDFSNVDAVVLYHEFDNKDKYIGSKRIQEFFLRAKKCVHNNAQPKHTDLDFMNLLSAFCGYTSFESFLDAEFGADYDSSQDDVLLELIDKYPFSTAEKDVLSQPKSKKPRELVPNAVFEPKTEYFLGREEDLNKITEQLHKHRTLVIRGEGGMGKTTLAATYYHRSINTKSYNTVAWLFCEQGTLKAIYELAYVLGLNFQGVDETDRLLMIQLKLKEMEEGFLLVLDNVEGDLAEFLNEFQAFRWDVLVTSRNRMDWEGIQEFEVPALSNPAAKALFKIHYRKPSGETLESGEEFEFLLEKLISAIGYNTLLIEIFAKQLREEFWDKGEYRFGLREFFNRLETQGLCLEESQERVRTKYAFYRRKKDVATATDILDILYDFSKLDKNLNSLLINLALLPVGNHRVDFLVELFQPKEKRLFRSNLKELYAKGWIGGDGFNEFRISPVIQDLTIKKHQEALWEEGKGLVERVTSLIRKEPDQDNMYTKFKWLPIAEKLADHLSGCQETGYYIFLDELALFLRSLGGRENLNRAAEELKQALASDLKNFGSDAPQTVIRRTNLGLVLKNLGGRENLDRAAEELEKALASYSENYDKESPAVAICRSNLASVLRDLGGRENLDRAVEELKQALASDLKNFSEESPKVATSRLNLGLVLQDLGGRKNLNRAAKELEQALASNLNNFSEEAPVVANSRSNLASVLRDLGGRKNLNRAVGELKQALACDLKNFGEASPKVATRRLNLALVLRDLGGRDNLYRAAEELDQALSSYLKNSGEDASAVANCRSYLGLVLRDLDRHDNPFPTVEELEQLLASDLKNFGDKSSVVAIRRNNLALKLLDLGGRENLNRAAEELKKALASHLNKFGEDSPETVFLRHDLASILINLQGKKNLLTAKTLLVKALTLSLHHFGEEDDLTQRVKSWLKVAEDLLRNE